jgi:hypothetical protein
MITGTFDSVTLKRVVGYKIAANWTPIVGFQGYFYVYVWDMQHPGTPFDNAVDVGQQGVPKRATLTLDGGERTYKFKTIDLISAQVGATRRFRYRLLEFRYDEAVVSNGNTPVEINNKGKDKVSEGGLGTAYQYALDDAAENLLGFRARMAAAGGNVVRFSTLRNNQNCFLKKMLKANDERNQGNRMSDFDITFSQGNMTVTQENLKTMYVDESFGYLQGEPQPPLFGLVAGGDALIRQAVTLKMDDYSQRELLALDVQQDPNPREADSRSIETATLVFNQGNYQNLRIT